MKQGTVKRNNGSMFPYQGWPTVNIDRDGVLYAVCSGHRIEHVCPFGKNLLYRSFDGGETWTEPQIINDTFKDDRDGGLAIGKDGTFILTWFNNEMSLYKNHYENDKNNPDFFKGELIGGYLKVCETIPDELLKEGSFARRSYDRGLTWTEPERVPVSAPHGPIFLRNGELLYLGKEFFSGTLEKDEIFACKYINGKWEAIGKVSLPPEINKNQVYEPHVIELPDGKLLGALRVQINTEQWEDFTIYLCRSQDGGKTWTTPEPTGISGSPPHLMLHSSGALIMSYARRRDNYSERVIISYDGGKTFGKEIVLRNSKTDDLGYPSTVELPDGSLITVYYHYLDEDDFASILYTKWTIEETER